MILVTLALALLLNGYSAANAQPLFPRTDSLRDTLSETVPTGIPPAHFEVSDFSITPEKGSALTVEWVKDSLEWVRVSEVLLIPRARIRIHFNDGIDSGVFTHGGYHQAFTDNDVSFPVALVEGTPGEFLIRYRSKSGDSYHIEKFQLVFRPKQEFLKDSKNRIYFDPSCSRFLPSAENVELAPNEWVYLGCRFIYTEGAGQHEPSLELYLFWNHPDPHLKMNGLEIDTTDSRIWFLRAQSKPSQILLSNQSSHLNLTWKLAPKVHYGSFGMGLGPYFFSIESVTGTKNRAPPTLTAYASYFLTDLVKLVAFNSTTLESTFFSYTGLYLKAEQARVFDRRLGLNLLLGLQFMGYKLGEDYKSRFNFPQGLELTYTDFLARNSGLSLGAFIYPEINQKSYFEAWLRWSRPQFFIELNSLFYRDVFDESQVYIRNIGLSVGFPIAAFL